jgi:hypothetical protein
MADEKITLSHEELYSADVDARLKQQEARARAEEHYRLQEDLASIDRPAAPSRSRFWYNPILYTGFFGLLGGLIAWGLGEVVEQNLLRSKIMEDARNADRFFVEARAINPKVDELVGRINRGDLNQNQLHEAKTKLLRDHADSPFAKAALEEVELILRARRGELNHAQFQEGQDKISKNLEQQYAENQIMAIELNRNLKDEEKDRLIKGLLDKEMPRLAIGDAIYWSQLGLLLACFLALADPVMGRNWRAAVVNGSVGTLLGMLGGLLVALFINQLYRSLGGGRLDNRLAEQMFARTVGWGVLGLFLAIAPGVVLRSWKRLAIGLVGGLVGGLIGGLTFDPLGDALRSGVPARGVGLATIGILTGAATGLIEQAAKRGWLYVAAGLIAGKQFILYRNPTVVGSSPRCEIYLFKDPEVSPRHAAVHRVHGGFELEDLGSATGTWINGRPVQRARLRDRDQVQIGSTTFLFRERTRTAADARGRPRPAATAPAPERETEPATPLGSDQIWERKVD